MGLSAYLCFMGTQYSMKAVTRLTGLSADRIRVWERRYQVVDPGRTATGRRTYSEQEVNRLKLIAELLPLGHSIRELSKLSDKNLMALRAGNSGPSASAVVGDELAGLMQAIGEFRFEDFEVALARVKYLISPQEFAFRLVPEILGEVGRKIDQGKFQIAQEHAVSDLLRHGLRQLYDELAPLQGRSRPVFVFAGPEGHLHDFGVLLAAIRCRFHGLQTHFLGANMPAHSLVQAAKELGASAVLLGISGIMPADEEIEINAYLQVLDRTLPAKASLWLGGAGVGHVKRKLLKRDAWIFSSLEELDRKLAGMGR